MRRRRFLGETTGAVRRKWRHPDKRFRPSRLRGTTDDRGYFQHARRRGRPPRLTSGAVVVADRSSFRFARREIPAARQDVSVTLVAANRCAGSSAVPPYPDSKRFWLQRRLEKAAFKLQHFAITMHLLCTLPINDDEHMKTLYRAHRATAIYFVITDRTPVRYAGFAPADINACLANHRGEPTSDSSAAATAGVLRVPRLIWPRPNTLCFGIDDGSISRTRHFSSKTKSASRTVLPVDGADGRWWRRAVLLPTISPVWTVPDKARFTLLDYRSERVQRLAGYALANGATVGRRGKCGMCAFPPAAVKTTLLRGSEGSGHRRSAHQNGADIATPAGLACF